MIPPPTPPDEFERLRTLRGLGLLDTAAEERFDRLTRLAQSLFGVPIALVTLVDGERQWFKSRQGLDLAETPRNVSFCAHAINGTGIFEVLDAAHDDRFADNPLVTQAPGIRFYAGTPLSAPDGQKVGALCLIDRRPRALSAEQKRILKDLGALVENEITANSQVAALKALREVEADARKRRVAGGETRRILAGFAVALAAMVAFGAMAVYGAHEFAATEHWVEHSQEVQRQLEGVLSLALDEQTGASDFVITGDRKSISRVDAAAAEMPGQLALLRDSLSDNKGQSRRLEVVARLASQRRDLAERTIRLRREKGLSAAAAFVAGGAPQRAMDELGAAVGAMEAEERRLHAERSANADESAGRLNAVVAVGGAAGALIVLVAFLFVRRDLDARALGEARLGRAHEEAVRAAEENARVRERAERLGERLKAVLDHMDSGVIQVERDGSMPIFNAAAERIHGAWRDDFEKLIKAGTHLPTTLDGRPLGPEMSPLGRAQNGETVNDFELFFRTPFRPNGYYLSVSAAPLLTHQGLPGGAVVVFRDISDRVRAAKRSTLRYDAVLALAQAKPGEDPMPSILKILVERIGWAYAGFWRPDAAGSFLRLAAQWHEPRAKTRAFADASARRTYEPGVGLPGRVWKARAPAWLNDVVTAQNFPRARAAEEAGLHEAFAFPILVGDRCLGVVEVLGNGVDDADADLLELAATLGSQIGLFMEGRRAAEERTRFFTLSLDMLCVAGFDGRFKSVNGAWEKTLGWSQAELLGIPFLDLVHPEDRRATYREALKTQRGGTAYQFENRYRCKDGSYKRLIWNIIPSVDEELVYSTARDVTDLRRVMAELAEARDAALSAARAKSEFLANMSHEIRTPMNAIIGMTGLLLDMTGDARQREYLETVRGAGDVLLTLINDILDFSKIEAGRLTLEAIDFELRDVIERAVELVAQRAQAKGLEVTVAIPPGAPAAVRGDPGRLRQVLLNLLGNAVKFTEKGEISVAVSAAEKDGRPWVAISVRDTGIGIPPEALDRLFQSFSQVDSSTTRKYGGTGLGLAISKQLVELMGGAISVDSTPGHGSIFRVELPFGRADAAPAGAPAAEPPELTSVRALVVDDNATNREIVRAQFAAWGIACDQAEGASAALAALRAAAVGSAPYGLAVLDYRMPETDGLELARAIRSDAALAALPMIMMTSMGVDQETAASAQAGLSACLSKPVRQSALLDAVMTALGGRPAPAPARRAAAPGPQAPAPVGRRLRVLVAEDNSVNQKVILLQLQKLGHAADAVASGREALESLEKIAYDLVLMDCQMPVMDGFEATRELRRREDALHLRRTPVVALTANAMAEDRRRCLAAGMDDYLAKPVNLADLARAIVENASAPLRAQAIRELREMAGEEGFRQIRDEFLSSSERLVGDLRLASDAGDALALRAAAHALKGASSSLGADGLAALCRELEARLESGSPVQRAAVVARVVDESERVRRALKDIA